jgi:hypothetical protein
MARSRIETFSSYCPVVEEFHIKNIMGCLQKKQWMLSGQTTITVGQTKAVTFDTLTGGLLIDIPSFEVVAQKVNVAPVNWTYVTDKASTGFVVNGDNGGLYHTVVFGTGPVKPFALKQNPKWAKDYCAYCDKLKYNGVVGSIFKDNVAFSFKWILSGASQVIDFKTGTDTTGRHVGAVVGVDNYFETGQQDHNLVTMMANTDYEVIITKSTDAGGLVVNPPWASALTKIGFTLNGDSGQEYDILIVGQIQF